MTKEDLAQIGELLVEERKHTRSIVGDAVEANNHILGTILKVELASTKQEIVTAMKAGFQETVQQIKRVEKKLDRITAEHEERIEQLEAANLPHKN